MSKDGDNIALGTCPFCRGGQTQIIPRTFWNGRENQMISATVRHWCDHGDGRTSTVLSIVGKDPQEAAARWNRGALAPDSAPIHPDWAACGSVEEVVQRLVANAGAVSTPETQRDFAQDLRDGLLRASQLQAAARA